MFSAIKASPAAGRSAGSLEKLTGSLREAGHRFAELCGRAQQALVQSPHQQITDFPRGAVLVPIEGHGPLPAGRSIGSR